MMESVKVAIISESAGNWPVYVGLGNGFFTQRNLNVNVVITRSSVKQMDDLKARGVRYRPSGRGSYHSGVR